MKNTPIPQKLFTQILRSMPICVVDILFLNKEMNKIALFKRNNEPLKNVYFSTGGRLLKNEKLIDCAKRQAMRGAGIKIKDKELIPVGFLDEVHKNSAFKGATYHAVVIFYYHMVDESKFKPKLDKQHNDFKWFSINDKNIHPFIKSRLKLIFNK